MSITYSIDEDDDSIIELSVVTSVDYTRSPGTMLEVRSFAQRHANAIGKPVEVFDHDRANYLFAVAPTA